MKTWTLREEIAKERFLDMMAGSAAPAEELAGRAVDEADLLIRALHNTKPTMPNEAFRGATKGCPSCFGSGGKRNNPCTNCGGSGRVPA